MSKGLRVAALSLIPWAAFLLTASVADDDVSFAGLVLAGPVYVGFVALPAAFPIAVASRRSTRTAAVVVMTVVAIAAAIRLATSEDAQAGLEVFWIPYAAVPLAAAIWLAQLALGTEESG